MLLEKEQELLEKEQTLSILREEVRRCCAAWGVLWAQEEAWLSRAAAWQTPRRGCTSV